MQTEAITTHQTPDTAARSASMRWFDSLHAAGLSTHTTPEFLAANPVPGDLHMITNAEIVACTEPDYETLFEDRRVSRRTDTR